VGGGASGARLKLPHCERSEAIQSGTRDALDCRTPAALAMTREAEVSDTLTRLEATIVQRLTASPETSYIARLHGKGLNKIAQKLGEEATETVIAALAGDETELVGEAADLLFHLMVLLAEKGLSLAAVLAELERREGTSGIDEKASRSA
jgi:phosphoribosyl-ATP pyrophosphohydrolase